MTDEGKLLILALLLLCWVIFWVKDSLSQCVTGVVSRCSKDSLKPLGQISIVRDYQFFSFVLLLELDDVLLKFHFGKQLALRSVLTWLSFFFMA